MQRYMKNKIDNKDILAGIEFHKMDSKGDRILF